MDYVPDGTLASLSASCQLLETDVKVLIRQVLDGLIFLRRQNIVHRDIKGTNLFITLDGCVKIGILGCATVIDPGTRPPRTLLSRSGALCFMSPELLFTDHYDERTDIWSLGIVIIELLKQGHPWARNKPARIVAMVFVCLLQFRFLGLSVIAYQVHECDQHLPALLRGITSESIKSLVRKIFVDQGARPSALQLVNDKWFSMAERMPE
ncbi:kinase-like domain-containing protein [Desarmillaria tabescens]|uniref:non-specific serine/threonine protein kinase n=1 Tax=Armillaria tabescens TaxID=1929756 RepID=A0AA39JBZ8_ARMTA|nr:kinase-like domain-containing protein [Desarmillaria tabescens]KAK0439945.1 kinase-like domain-containing protein [Desarmillaria tabescens]